MLRQAQRHPGHPQRRGTRTGVILNPARLRGESGPGSGSTRPGFGPRRAGMRVRPCARTRTRERTYARTWARVCGRRAFSNVSCNRGMSRTKPRSHEGEGVFCTQNSPSHTSYLTCAPFQMGEMDFIPCVWDSFCGGKARREAGKTAKCNFCGAKSGLCLRGFVASCETFPVPCATTPHRASPDRHFALALLGGDGVY